MSVHFRIVSADGNTLLDHELANESGSVGIPADDVQKLLDEANGQDLMFVVDRAGDATPKHKLPCDWSVLD